MNIIKGFFFAVLFCAAMLCSQTIFEGQNVFTNDENDIVLAVDASIAVREFDGPYVMFMIYMGSKDNQRITVERNDVVMIYKDQEYKMPTLKELRKTYRRERLDLEQYRRLGKESLALSEMRMWEYQEDNKDFFGMLNSASMMNRLGFRTRAYFKNPGFKIGDEVVIKVKDKERPDIAGSITVILK